MNEVPVVVPVEVGGILDGIKDKLTAALAGILNPEQIKKIVLGAVRDFATSVVVRLKAEAEKTATPLDDMAVKVLEDLVVKYLTPDQPKEMLATADEDWKRRFKEMSPDERKEEIRRLIVEQTGYQGVISAVLISLLANLAVRFGLPLLKDLIAKLFSKE